MAMGAPDEKGDEKRGHIFIDSQQLDTGAQLDPGTYSPLDPGESLRIR